MSMFSKEIIDAIPHASGIYCIRNCINGKCYIGSAIDLNKKIIGHYYCIINKKNANDPLYSAIIKDGADVFNVDVIETVDKCDDIQDKLKKLEDKYIEDYDSRLNGYNVDLSIKEDVCVHEDDSYIVAHELLANKYYKNITYNRASELSGVSIDVIKMICDGKYSSKQSNNWTFGYTEISMFNNCAAALREIGRHD